MFVLGCDLVSNRDLASLGLEVTASMKSRYTSVVENAQTLGQQDATDHPRMLAVAERI